MSTPFLRPHLLIVLIVLLLVTPSCWNDSTGSNGVNIYPITALLLNPDSCAVNAEDQVECSTLIAASDGGGIFRSLDGGEKWSESMFGLLDFGITDMVMDPADPTVLFASTENSGLFASYNGGISWEGVINTVFEITDIAIDPTTCHVPPCTDIYISSRETGIWVTKNGGLSWTQLNDGLLGETAVTAIEVFSYNVAPSIVFVGTEEGNLYRLNSLRTEWEKIVPGLAETTSATPLVITVNPITPTDIYVGTSGGEGESQGGVFQSVNGGQTWAKVEIPNDSNFSVRSIEFCLQREPQCPPTVPDPEGGDLMDQRPPDTLFAGVFGLSRTFSIHDPQVTNWENINLNDEIREGNNTSVLVFDPIRHTAIYAGTLQGFIMKSLDGGVTWGRLDPEL
jgi:photosystem II stability/assembly factor-like uncharacterized protein